MSNNNGDFNAEENSDADDYFESFAHRDNDAEYGGAAMVAALIGQVRSHSDADEDYESFAPHRDNDAEYADAGNAALFATLIAQVRTSDPIFADHHLVIRSAAPDPIRLELAEALTQNTVVRGIVLQPHDYSKVSADAMAKYLAQSKRLQKVKLMDEALTLFEFLSGIPPFGFRRNGALCSFLEAIGQSNSVKELILTNLSLGPVSESFENLLTRTQTLQDLQVVSERRGPFEEAAVATIASGFSKNTTLREINLVSWDKTSLIPVLTALRAHPVLEKLQVEVFSSFNGIDFLVGSKQSQLKELLLVGFIGGSTVEAVAGFDSFMQEMGRNNTISKMVIASVPLSRDNIQQLTAMLRRNTVLQDLDLSGDDLGSAGLAELVSALYRNTSIESLDVSDNSLDDLAAANALRELLRRNKTIIRLCMDQNTFGNNVAIVRCIADGFRANTTLQLLNLSSCGLDDQGLSILAKGLGQRKRSLRALHLCDNQVTCSGLRALVDNATAALSTVTKLDLCANPLIDEGAIFLADTLRRQTLPSLKCLHLIHCRISDDGFSALVSALEENETLEAGTFGGNTLSARGYLALTSSLPNIKGLRQIDFSLPTTLTTDPSVMPALLKGFRKNTSLHEVNIHGCEHCKWSKELTFLLYRNKFSRLLQDSDTDDRESLGLWSRALGSVATRADVLFHVLTSKAGLIRATPGEDSNKRKRDGSE